MTSLKCKWSSIELIVYQWEGRRGFCFLCCTGMCGRQSRKAFCEPFHVHEVRSEGMLVGRNKDEDMVAEKRGFARACW